MCVVSSERPSFTCDEAELERRDRSKVVHEQAPLACAQWQPSTPRQAECRSDAHAQYVPLRSGSAALSALTILARIALAGSIGSLRSTACTQQCLPTVSARQPFSTRNLPPCHRGRALLGACLAVDAETKLIDVTVKARVARLTCTGSLRGSIESRLVRSSSLHEAKLARDRSGSGLLYGGLRVSGTAHA